MSGHITNFRVLSTIFLLRQDGQLKHLLRVQIDNSGETVAGRLEAQLAGAVLTFDLPAITPGRAMYPISVPEVSQATPAHFTLRAAGEERGHELTLQPVRHWKVHLIHFSHHDLGYTDLPQVCIDQHKGYFDHIIEYCRQTDNLPEEARFRWTCDTTWALKFYVNDRPPEVIEQFMALVRAGRIEITAQFAAFNSALLSHEELVRSLYYAHELAQKYDFRVTSAMITDIPGAPWGFPQVLAKSGIRYLSSAVNQEWSQSGVPRARVPRIARPFYWGASDGSEVLVWNTDPQWIYFEGLELGLTTSYERTHDRLPRYLTALEEDGYPFDAIHLRTTYKGCDNVPPCPFLPRIVQEWNSRYAYPQLILATNSQFFEYMEKTYGDQFPHYSGDWTDWWIDGPGSSAYETGLNRVTHEELASAEKLAALGSLLHGDAYPQAEISQAYDDMMLYDEHTWGMWNNWSDPFLPSTSEHWQFKAAFAHRAAQQTGKLLQAGMQGLGRRIATGSQATIAVFNPLSWARSDVVTVTLPEGTLPPDEPFAVLTEDGQVVPHQRVEDPSTARQNTTITFLAPDVPALGYRTFYLAPGKPQAGPAGTHTAENVIENRYYRVTLDTRTGGIASIYDKELQIELVDKDSPYRLNQYVYDSGEPPINGRFSPESASIHPGSRGPVAGSLVAITRCRVSKDIELSDTPRRGLRTKDITPWIRQEVILYEGQKRIDIVDQIYKEETMEKEGIYYAFPCNVPKGRFRVQVAGASMEPGVDQLPDSGHDWHTAGYWLDVSNADYGVTWSSREVPVVSIGDINTGRWQTSLALNKGTFFAYVMNNYWNCNFKERQGGYVTFRFSLTSHGPEWDSARAARFGWGYCTDLQAIVLPAGQEGPLSTGKCSFCQIDQPNVMAFTLKRAEDGDGYIVRLIELAGKDTVTRLRLPGVAVVDALRTNIMEENGERLAVVDGEIILPIPAFGIETLRLHVSR